MTDWNKIRRYLEKIHDPAFTAKDFASALPHVGSELTCGFGGGYIRWVILGYNGTVPRYIRFRNSDGNAVYVSSVKNNALVDRFAGGCAYRKDGPTVFTETGLTVGDQSDSFMQFGRTDDMFGTESRGGPYSVPLSIRLSDGRDYYFCGNTMTITSADVICHGGRHLAVFSKYTNNYSESAVRKYLNGTGSERSALFVDAAGERPFNLRWHFKDDFMNSVAYAVNKVRISDGACVYCTDLFYLLSTAEVNCMDYEDCDCRIADMDCALVSFSAVFKDSVKPFVPSRCREKYLNGDETCWMLRNKNMKNDREYWSVCEDSSIECNSITDSESISPACIIG